MNDNVTFTFPVTEQVQVDPPADQPPARFDADPGVSAEIAVERGVATPVEVAWVDWLIKQDEAPTFETGDKIESEVTPEQAKPLTPAIGFETGDEPLLADEDGTFTKVESMAPDPTQERND